MQREPVRRGGQRAPDLLERVLGDRGFAALIILALLVEVRPAPVQPVGLVRLVVLARLELFVEVGLESGLHILDLALGDQAILHQTVGVELQRRLVSLDLFIHEGVGEHRFIPLVVAETAVAEDVDHHVLVELLPELGRHLGGVNHGLGIVAVHMEDRRFHHQRDIRRIGRGARERGCGGETDLVVHDDVDRAAGAVATDTRQLEALGHDALPGKGRVPVQKHRDHLVMLGVFQLVALGAGFAQHDRVHRFEVRGVGGQRQVDGVAVELPVARRAEVVFHIARPVHVLGLEAAALKLVEDRAVGLGHHVGQHRQTTPVRHPDDDFLDTEVAAALDDLLHRRDQGFATVEAEPLGAHILDVQEFLEPFGLDQLVQDRATPFAGEADFLAVAFDPFLEPTGFFRVRDVHVLQREGAAVGGAHDVDDLAHRRDFEPKYVVEEDRAIHVGLGEAVGFRVKLGVARGVAHPQRVDVGGKVAPDPVGPDNHQRADRVEHGAFDRILGNLDFSVRRLVRDLFRQILGRFFRLGGPLTVKRVGQVVAGLRRPVGAHP